MRPHTVAGLCGMALVAALYVVYSRILQWTGDELGLSWLLALLLPGVLAGHLSLWRDNDSELAAREGALAGAITAHFAALLLLSLLALGVLNTDWAHYARQVGPEIASAVHDAALPAAIVAGAITAGITYAGCTLAGWLGALVYVAAREPVRSAYCILRKSLGM
ncbi:MAG: hypothetical protein IVW55_08530 [Chloroflexi bacterium]|nr:hypothetical protein [Chloroflexota bacterium]